MSPTTVTNLRTGNDVTGVSPTGQEALTGDAAEAGTRDRNGCFLSVATEGFNEEIAGLTE